MSRIQASSVSSSTTVTPADSIERARSAWSAPTAMVTGSAPATTSATAANAS